MIRSRSDTLRFEVLKLLNENPNHGYGLYLLLKDDDIVKRPSDLYKILGSMKDNKLITESEKEESEQGPDKKILKLTEKGVEEYYECIFDSAKIVIDFLIGLNWNQSTPIDEELRDRLKNDIQNTGNIIFLDIASNIPIRFQVEMIKQYIVPMDIEVIIYLQVPQEIDRSVFRPLNKTKVNLQILDENVGLKPNTVDYVFTFEGGSKRRFSKKLQLLKTYLKNEGTLIVLVNTKRIPELNKIFGDFAQTIFSSVPKDFHKKLLEIIPRFDLTDLLGKQISSEQTKEILNNHFKDIEVIEDFEDVEIIILKEPKLIEPVLEQVQN